MRRTRIRMRRAEAVPDDAGMRHCASCGDFIDPIDWCYLCQKASAPCATSGGPHHRLRKRADAAFCNDECRWEHRSSFIRDCI